MDERHYQILGSVVREYVRTARPVGSASLTARSQHQVSPATIRALLHELEEAGYIYQPHTSAGRIPTDLGYRYVVDHTSEGSLSDPQRLKLHQQFSQLEKEYRHLARSASKLLADLTQTIAVSGSTESGDVQEAGLQKLLELPEAETLETIRELSRVLDGVEQRLRELATSARDEATVFIGEEIPFFPAQYTSLVVRTIVVSPQHSLVIALIGPKRMAYQRNVSLLNAVARYVTERYL